MKLKPLPLFAFAIFFSFTLFGCSPTHVAYHSTADVPYFTKSTSTQMELVVGEEEASRNREYVVFAATDNQDVSYVLLAPKKSNKTGYSFEAARIGRAVPLKGESLNSLIEGLAQTLQIWDEQSKEGSGTFYEFMHAPEQDINRMSENVVRWHPATKFTASHTPDGPTGRLLLGDSPKKALQYVVEFDSREGVADFREVLQEARDRVGIVASR